MDGHQLERDGLLCLAAHTHLFSLFIYDLSPPSLPYLGLTDVTAGLKLNTHAFISLYVLALQLGVHSTSTGTGCLLKVAVGIFIRVTRGQLNFV